MTSTATNQQRASGGFSFTSVSVVPVFVVLLLLRGVLVLITRLPQMAGNMYKLVRMWWNQNQNPSFNKPVHQCHFRTFLQLQLLKMKSKIDSLRIESFGIALLKGFRHHSSRSSPSKDDGSFSTSSRKPTPESWPPVCRTQPQCLVRPSRSARLPVMVLGQVGNERYGHAHIDACPNGDWQHGQEESPPGGGACQVEVAFRHCFVGLRGWEEEDGGVRNLQAR